MCELVSWKEVIRDGRKHFLWLNDKEVFSERSQELMRGAKDNDFLGHHAIDLVMDLKGEGQDRENRNFWDGNLPKELQAELADFPTFQKNFGKMVEEYAQRDDLDYIIQNAPKNEKWKGLKEFCQKARFNQLLKNVTTEKVMITLRSDRSIEELVKQAKFNGYVNPNVNDRNFKEKQGPEARKQEAILLCLNRYAKTEEVEEVMKCLRLKAHGVKALLSLAIDYPDLQKKFTIVELGSFWQYWFGRRCVPCLWGGSGERRLSLDDFGSGWGDCCRFLVFSEV